MNPGEYIRMYEVEDSHWWYVGLHELILAIIKNMAQPGQTLDIFDAGCGTGRLCQLLQEQGHRVTGCDASGEAVRLCRQRGIDGVYQADLNSIELEPESVDVITSIDVLYHTGISDDVAVLQRLQRALRPGGLLILNLVAHEFLRSTHDIAVHTRERYTRKSACGRLHAAGFDILAATYRVSILFPFIAAYRLLLRLVRQRGVDPEKISSDVSLPHPVINALLLKSIKLENLFLKTTTLPIGSSIFVVARKPHEEESERSYLS